MTGILPCLAEKCLYGFFCSFLYRPSKYLKLQEFCSKKIPQIEYSRTSFLAPKNMWGPAYIYISLSNFSPTPPARIMPTRLAQDLHPPLQYSCRSIMLNTINRLQLTHVHLGLHLLCRTCSTKSSRH